ncbi:bile acid-sensitive ion channel-like [Glandiceps talaboti]
MTSQSPKKSQKVRPLQIAQSTGPEENGVCVRFRHKARDFMSETSLHGAKNIVDTRQNIVRRLLWVVLVIGLSTWLLITLYNEVKVYLEYSVTTVISVKYTPFIEFPAVTLCNYNRYRKSVIGGTPIYELMEKMFSSGSLDPKPKVDFDWSLLENSTATTNRNGFEMEAAHQKEQLIQGCRFTGGESGRHCGPENFTAVFTQFGVCYTFNNDPDNQLKVYEMGSRTGLRLRLYTQEDEYTYGLRTGSGFKLILHPPGYVPMVNRLGFAIPTGVEALVSVKVKKTESLESPYQTMCNRTPLTHWPKYSYVMCCLEMLTKSIVKLCGCKEPYMPGTFGGLMGLALGASMVTMVEFIDFLLFCGFKRS